MSLFVEYLSVCLSMSEYLPENVELLCLQMSVMICLSMLEGMSVYWIMSLYARVFVSHNIRLYVIVVV